jgi:hypothetical protein
MIEQLDKESKVDRRLIYEITGIKFKDEDFDKDFGEETRDDELDPNRAFAKKVSIGSAFWKGFKPGIVEPMIASSSESIN